MFDKVRNTVSTGWDKLVDGCRAFWHGLTHPSETWAKLTYKISYYTIFIRDWWNGKFKIAMEDWAALGIIFGTVWMMYLLAFPIETLLVTLAFFALSFLWNFPSMRNFYKNIWKPRVDSLRESGKDIVELRRAAAHAAARAQLDRNLINVQYNFEMAAEAAVRSASVGSAVNRAAANIKQADEAGRADSVCLAKI